MVARRLFGRAGGSGGRRERLRPFSRVYLFLPCAYGEIKKFAQRRSAEGNYSSAQGATGGQTFPSVKNADRSSRTRLVRNGAYSRFQLHPWRLRLPSKCCHAHLFNSSPPLGLGRSGKTLKSSGPLPDPIFSNLADKIYTCCPKKIPPGWLTATPSN